VVQLALADTIFLLSLPISGSQQLTQEWTLGKGDYCKNVWHTRSSKTLFLTTAIFLNI